MVRKKTDKFLIETIEKDHLINKDHPDLNEYLTKVNYLELNQYSKNGFDSIVFKSGFINFLKHKYIFTNLNKNNLIDQLCVELGNEKKEIIINIAEEKLKKYA